MIEPNLHIRIARPVRDLDTAEDFYVRGLGLSLLDRITGRIDPEQVLGRIFATFCIGK